MLVIVDSAGGRLSSVGAAVARASGHEAIAATTDALASAPDEVRAVLAEVEIAASADVVPYEPGEEDATIYVGPTRAGDELEAKARRGGRAYRWVEADLYTGPNETEFGDAYLERLACARILRDRLEAAITALSASSTGVG